MKKNLWMSKKIRQFVAAMMAVIYLILWMPMYVSADEGTEEQETTTEADASAQAEEMRQQITITISAPQAPVSITEQQGNASNEMLDSFWNSYVNWDTAKSFGAMGADTWLDLQFKTRASNFIYNTWTANKLNNLVWENPNLSQELFDARRLEIFEQHAAKLQIASRAAGGLSAALNLYAFYGDAKDLVQGNLYAESTTGKVLETGLLLADMTVAVIGVAVGIAALCGAAATGVPLLVGLGIGLTAAFVHSEFGAKLVDKFGRIVDSGVASLWQGVKDTAFVLGLGAKLLWNGAKNIGKQLLDMGSNFLTDAGNWINDKWQGFKEGVKDFGDMIYDKLSHLVRQVFGTGAYKPNIYIYTDEPTEVTVVFTDPAMLTNVIPDYSGEWAVTAEGDGTLITDTGEEIGFLFYESETQPHLFQRSEGYLIPAEYRAQTYAAILAEYGFNGQEIADFVEYWVEKLPAGVDYVMYPQGTETVDMAMPVVIAPEPEQLFRMWFAFECYDGQEFAEPEPEWITRDGLTVVEWGGLILDER